MFYSIIFYEDELFPGFWALPPCLGAVLYIAGGTGYTFSNRKNIIHLITNNRLFVFIGVISYSLYLWHWPVFVFYTTFPILKPITLSAACVLIPIVFVISYLSWRFVEKPVRQLPLFKNRKFLWTATFICIGCVFTMATYMRYPKVYKTYVVHSYSDFLSMPRKTADIKGKIPVDFIFIGDSYKLSNQKLFQKLADKYQLTGATIPKIVVRNVVRTKDFERLKRYQTGWDNLTNLYNTYCSKNLFIIFRNAEKINGKDRYYSQDKAYPAVYLPNRKLTSKQAFLQGLRDMIDEAQANGIERIYIQMPVPEPKDSIPHKASMLTFFMEYSVAEVNKKLGETLAEFQERNKYVFEAFDQLKEEYPQIEFVDVAPYLLNKETQQFAVMDDKELYYYDNDHLSFEGTMKHYDAYDKIFAKIAKEKSEHTSN